MSSKNYNALLKYYQEMFDLFDDIHFNSSVTESVYKKHLTIRSSAVIPITHSQIADNRVSRGYESSVLNLIFIGNTTTYKGFPLLQEVLLELYNEGKRDWQLDIWGAAGSSECSLIRYNGFFKSNELSKVFHTDSVLVTPSVCNETFSLITLEALSYGIPALVSSTVGAKDIVSQYDPWFVFTDKADLKAKLGELLSSKKRLVECNRSIIDKKWRDSIEDHSRDIIAFYRRTK